MADKRTQEQILAEILGPERQDTGEPLVERQQRWEKENIPWQEQGTLKNWFRERFLR